MYHKISRDYNYTAMGAVNLEMQQCCPVTDSISNTNNNDCQIIGDGSSEPQCRTVGLKTAFCDPFDKDQKCTQRDLIRRNAVIDLRYALQESDRSESCCAGSCTCFGDPHCVSFSGDEESWILCDARDKAIPKQKKSVCELKRSKCMEQLDHEGNQCAWVGGGQGKCVYNPLSSEPFMLMYSADDFKFEIRMADRGIIDGAKLSIADHDSIFLSQEDCIAGYNFTIPDSIQEEDNNRLQFSKYIDRVNNRDILWRITDTETNIIVRLRCTDKGMNIEELIETDRSYLTSRLNLGGFCATRQIDTQLASTENTNLIESGAGCIENDGAEDHKLTAARSLCNNPSLQTDQIATCFTSFCDTHSFPNYDSTDQCVEKMLLNSTRHGFCYAFRRSATDIKECNNFIKDFGWDDAITKYVTVKSGDCGEKSVEFPKELGLCEKGTVVEYYVKELDEWVVKFVIPDSYLPCDNGGRLELRPEEDYELFVRPVRFRQCGVSSDICGLANTCEAQSGMKVDIEYRESGEDIGEDDVDCSIDRLLCGTIPFYGAIDNNDDEAILGFEPCCGIDSTENTELDHDPKCNSTISNECRVVGFDAPACSLSDITKDCSNLSNATLQLELVYQPKNESCCGNTCSCAGDPHCTSFDGTKQSWILCDARAPTSRSNNMCLIQESTCLIQIDHDGNQCQWTGSSCTPNQNSSSSWLLLYEIDDTLKIEARQSERGLIQEVRLNNNLSLSADTCNITGTNTGTVLENSWYNEGGDVVWKVLHKDTNVRAKLRCTSAGGSRFINVEAISEPNADSRNNSSAGFCVTNSLGRTGSTENSDKILRGEGCDPWGHDQDDEIDALRAICRDPQLTKQGMDACRSTFCQAYAFPNFPKVQNCVAGITQYPKKAFCRALNSDVKSREACEDHIHDFGWQSAAERYIANPSVCVSDASSLPTEMNKCQQGVELQYLANPFDFSSWVTYKAIPEHVSLCPGFRFTALKDEVLFTHAVRIKQCAISEECAMNFCSEQNGVQAKFTFSGFNTLSSRVNEVVDRVEGNVTVRCDNKEVLSSDEFQSQLTAELYNVGLLNNITDGVDKPELLWHLLREVRHIESEAAVGDVRISAWNFLVFCSLAIIQMLLI